MIKDMRKLVEEGYEKADYAGTFRTDAKPKEIEEYFLKKLVKLVPKHAKILDLGCGIGIPFDRYLVNQGFNVTGVDICQKHINLAREKVPEAKFIKADFSKIDFNKESFDAIISLYAVFHIPREEHKALFLKIRRLIRKEGIILVTLGTSNSEYGEEKDWCGALMAWSTYDPDRYRKMISDSGFTILESTFEGRPEDEEYHFWVLGQTKSPNTWGQENSSRR